MAAYTAGFMTHATCRLTDKNWDQLRNITLGNRVWATFISFYYLQTFINISFHTSAITNIDHVDALFVFIRPLYIDSVTFCSTNINAFD